ncbi:MAG: DNA methylase [Alistipes sp.]|nr:DNA methylase [Candidatus Alistipes equi]
MNRSERTYVAIDLKSFYASVECVERGLDPLSTNLVVADISRTEKTICLAVSPSLKAYGIPGRARLFEVIAKVREENQKRLRASGRRHFLSKSYLNEELLKDSSIEIDYIAAPPRMAKYIEYSAKIYSIYLKYVAPEDIHVYSIDEVFMDLTQYLPSSHLTAEQFTRNVILDIFQSTGITATAGIGTNLYLAKIAMDIKAKYTKADKNGVRIASLNERTYREQMWDLTPLTRFWRVGTAIAQTLKNHGMVTMGDVALCSIKNEELLYKLFGVNAELLIDHAWGYEPCTIYDIKSYHPESSTISSSQVLSVAYDMKHAKTIVKEMADRMAMDLFRKHLLCSQVILHINYDAESFKSETERKGYTGEISKDYYGREVPKSGHHSLNLKEATCSSREITNAFMELFERIVNQNLLIRRITLTLAKLLQEKDANKVAPQAFQADLFSDVEQIRKEMQRSAEEKKKERLMQKALIEIEERFGRNSILKGTNFQEGATGRKRNAEIGGHKA